MDQKTRQLEKRIADQYRELATLEDIYDTLAAHDLYERFRQVGLSRVRVHSDPGSMLVETASGNGADGDPEAIADRIFDDWRKEYLLSSAGHLLRKEGPVLDPEGSPYGVTREEAQAHLDRGLSQAETTGPTAQEHGVDLVARGAHISKTLSDVGGIPAEEITDASTADEMIVGIGPVNEEDNHPYVLHSNGDAETELRAHAPEQPGGDRLVETYKTDEANTLVENVTYDLRVDIDEVDREQRLREQQTALNQLPNTQAGVTGPGIG